jgi:protein-disulfide isomerase
MKTWKLGLMAGAVTALLSAGTGRASAEDRLVRDGEPMRGRADAPVTVVMFCDFQCPYCADAQPVVNQLLTTHPSDVRVVYRHFPVERVHGDAGRAAEASMCAMDQGRFWEMSSSMLSNQNDLDLNGLIRQATALKLDSRAFTRCLESGQHRADWRRDQTDGMSLGVSGTPSFFVNGTFIEGASIENLDAAVRSALGR